MVRSCTLFFKVPGEVDCLALDLAWPLTLDLLMLSLLDLLLGFEPELLLLALDLALDVLLLDPLAVDRDLWLLDLIRLEAVLLDPGLEGLDPEGEREILLLGLTDTVLEELLPRLLGESLLLSLSRPC